MIINTGARTDIPAFFSEWFFNRIKEGFVHVRNPYYHKQVTRYQLNPEVVDLIVFCTKNPRPILQRIHDLDKFKTYFFVTITPYGKEVEPNVPPVKQVINDFKALSTEIGEENVCWRYDPIFINQKYTVEKHIEKFENMASQLSDYTNECVISFIDLYEKTKRNFLGVKEVNELQQIEIAKSFFKIGSKYDISLKTCAEAINLENYGFRSSGCISKEVVERSIGKNLKEIRKKPNRFHCGCIPNRDIGAYNTCLYGCKYCYANSNQYAVQRNFKLHNPKSSFLVGEMKPGDTVKEAFQESYINKQIKLF